MIRVASTLLAVTLFSQIGFALTNSVATEDTAFQNDVFISTSAQSDDGSPVNGYCNASLISAQILVTAAHCVAESLALKKNLLHIEVGAYKYVARASDAKQVRVGYVPLFKKDLAAQFIVSRSLQKKIAASGVKTDVPPADDVAIIVLSQKLDLDANFVFANVIPQKIWELIRGQKDLAQFSIASINYWETSTVDFKRSASLDKFSFIGPTIQSQSTSRVEEGDSGSPVYVHYQNQVYLVAVVKGLATILSTWNWDVLPILPGKICDIARENAATDELIALVCR